MERKKGRTYPNLFDAHPPFQIDDNFGCTAGIAETLMQNHDGFVYLLPALPANWKEGRIRGIEAHGGFELKFCWKNGKLDKFTIYSSKGGNFHLRTFTLVQGKGLKKAHGENPSAIYEVPQVMEPVVSKEVKLHEVRLKKTYLYGLNTKAGESYTIAGR